MSVKAAYDLVFKVWEYLDSGENKSPGPITHEFSVDFDLTSGTVVGSADLVWSDRRSRTTGASEVLDLAGVLTDSFGTTITFVEIVLVAIRNRDTVDGEDFQVGPDATNGWVGMVMDASDRIRVPAGGHVIWYDPNGQAVGAGATDELWIQNDGSSTNQYDIIIVGRSA